MRYILIIIPVLFFLGCSPKYRSVNEYIPPKTEAGQMALSGCQQKLESCKSSCKANFDSCKVKAEAEARKSFDKKMHEYTIRLEQYASDMDMYELEMDLLYFDGFGYYGGGYGYGGLGYRGFYRPHGMFLMGPSPLFRPVRPRKPNLQAEIQAAQMQMCQIDCGCQKAYDSCFVSSGGELKVNQVCIKNCPSER
jgi:hypothetical protein